MLLSTPRCRIGAPALFAMIAIAILLALIGGPVPGATTEQASAQTTSPWQFATPFQNGRTSASSVRIGHRVYITGGYSYDSVAQQLNIYHDVQWARLDPDGGLTGGWHQTTPFSIERLGQSAVRYGRYIYVVGGGNGFDAYFDDVEYAKVGANGNITAAGWQTSPHHLNFPRAALTTEVKVVDGRPFIYAIGGAGSDAQGNTIHFANVEYARIHADGSIGRWHVSPYEFNMVRSSQTTAFVRNCLYVVGGFGDRFEDIFADVQYACLKPDGSGALGPWTTSPNPMLIARYGAEMVVKRRPDGSAQFVEIGGNAGGGTYLNEIERSTIPANSPVNSPWEAAPEENWLPAGQWGQTGVLDRGVVYVLGGVLRSQEYLNEVKYATLGDLFP
jgi:hypothetical protein